MAERDEQAFGVFYERHADAAFAVARGVCRRHEIAEDATQEALFALWRDAATFTAGPSAPAAWVHVVVRNRSVDALRRLATQRRIHLGEEPFDQLPVAAPPPDDEVVARDCERLLADAVARLPGAQREVIGLAYHDGLSQREIADRLVLPLGTVKGRVRLALERLARDPRVIALAASGP